jgi:Cdc6-like AAA superfamily ATPase
MFKIGTFNKKDSDFQPVAVLHTKTTPRDGLTLMVDTSKRSIAPTRDVILPEGEYFALEPTNIEDGRDVIMVGGKSGSGKSHTAKNFAIRYHILWPKRTIRLISFLDEDETLDSLPFIKRVKAEEIKGDEESTDLKKYEKSLTIFDDIEGFEREDPEMHSSLQQIIDMIATTGRHTASSLLVASHLLTDYKRFVARAAPLSTFEVT